MEEMEVPMEHLHEKINEEAEGKSESEKERWILYVALSTAFVAVLAAIAGLLGGYHANEALIDQIRSSDQWSFYQAKAIKSDITSSANHILQSLSTRPVSQEDQKKVARYEKEKQEIRQKAEEYTKSSEMHLERHVTLAKSVTLFQIAIAIAAISILTKKRLLWAGSIILAVIGLVFLLMGII